MTAPHEPGPERLTGLNEPGAPDAASQEFPTRVTEFLPVERDKQRHLLKLYRAQSAEGSVVEHWLNSKGHRD